MSDALHLRGWFRLFNAKDEFNKESVAIEAETSLHMKRLLRILERFKTERELPNMMRMDYGPEFLVRFSWTGARSTGCSSTTCSPANRNRMRPSSTSTAAFVMKHSICIYSLIWPKCARLSAC